MRNIIFVAFSIVFNWREQLFFVRILNLDNNTRLAKVICRSKQCVKLVLWRTNWILTFNRCCLLLHRFVTLVKLYHGGQFTIDLWVTSTMDYLLSHKSQVWATTEIKPCFTHLKHLQTSYLTQIGFFWMSVASWCSTCFVLVCVLFCVRAILSWCLKLDISSLFTTFFLWTFLQYILDQFKHIMMHLERNKRTSMHAEVA